jgi:hypothetical protein
MKILSIEIDANSAVMVFVEGNKTSLQVVKSGKFLSIPKNSESIKDILEFQTNFSMFLQEEDVELVVLCEGGNDSGKKRLRMEFAILSECEKQSKAYNTYASSACTKLIKTSYAKETGRDFYADLNSFGLQKYMDKALVAAWRFI